MKTLFTVSFLVAVAAFVGPFIMDSAARVSFLLAMCWLVLSAVALFRFRKKGLWLLIGLPFTLYWPLRSGRSELPLTIVTISYAKVAMPPGDSS
jgi:hypothetical protein